MHGDFDARARSHSRQQWLAHRYPQLAGTAAALAAGGRPLVTHPAWVSCLKGSSAADSAGWLASSAATHGLAELLLAAVPVAPIATSQLGSLGGWCRGVGVIAPPEGIQGALGVGAALPLLVQHREQHRLSSRAWERLPDAVGEPQPLAGRHAPTRTIGAHSAWVA